MNTNQKEYKPYIRSPEPMEDVANSEVGAETKFTFRCLTHLRAALISASGA